MNALKSFFTQHGRDQVAPTRMAVVSRAILQSKDQRQRHFAFLQVAEHGLSEFFRRRGEVEQIVDKLKREAGLPTIFGERVAGSQIIITEHSAELRAAAEQARRLAIRKVDRFRFGQVDAVETSEL